MNRRTLVRVALLVAMLVVMTMPVSAAAPDRVLRVGPGQEYTTIQAAVDVAEKHSRILVYPATYVEAVSVTTDKLQILAQGDGVIVTPPAGPAGFYVRADHVTVRGFRIGFGAGCAPAIDFHGSHNTFADNYAYLNASCIGVNAIMCRDPDGGSDSNTIEGNTIDQSDTGIEIQGTPDGINRNNTIRDNTLLGIAGLGIGVEAASDTLITGNDIQGVADGICIALGTGIDNTIPQGHHRVVDNTMDRCAGNGISLYAAPGGTLRHNLVEDNWVQYCGADCIALEAGEGATLSHNQVLDNEASFSTLCGIKIGSYPVEAPGASLGSNQVQGNTVFRNLSGVCLTSGADKNKVLKNLAQDNTADGFVVTGHNNRIKGNEAHDNDSAGIQVQGQKNRIRKNATHDNGVSGIEVDGNQNKITRNTANDNGNAGINVQGDDNAIWKNTALGNGVFDLADYGTGNRWRTNEYETSNW